MKKISKILSMVALFFVLGFSLVGCNANPEITIDYLTFKKLDSYVMNFVGAGAGSVVGVSVFKVNTNLIDGILIEYDDFAFVNENGSLLSTISIEIFDKAYNVTEETLDLVVLDKNSTEGFQLAQNNLAYLVIKCASSTIGGKHVLSYLSTTIDEMVFTF